MKKIYTSLILGCILTTHSIIRPAETTPALNLLFNHLNPGSGPLLLTMLKNLKRAMDQHNNLTLSNDFCDQLENRSRLCLEAQRDEYAHAAAQESHLPYAQAFKRQQGLYRDGYNPSFTPEEKKIKEQITALARSAMVTEQTNSCLTPTRGSITLSEGTASTPPAPTKTGKRPRCEPEDEYEVAQPNPIDPLPKILLNDKKPFTVEQFLQEFRLYFLNESDLEKRQTLALRTLCIIPGEEDTSVNEDDIEWLRNHLATIAQSCDQIPQKKSKLTKKQKILIEGSVETVKEALGDLYQGD